MATIIVSRMQPDFGFEATDESGKSICMDTNPDGGGLDFGVSPMQTLLMALGGCSGIDVVSILKKQRQEFTAFSMKIFGDRVKGKVPSLWEKVHVDFMFTGTVDEEKAKYAAQLSMEKYCSVAETLRLAGCTITWNVIIDSN